MTVTCAVRDGVAEVVIDHPPVNAITIADTWAIDSTSRDLARNDDVRAVILTAVGRGFNAGIDIKEMQAGDSRALMVESCEACDAGWEAIWQCPAPVIAAVNDFCLGVGIGLVASCDMIVATRHARFALPEVDNGSPGCASHLARLVPPMKLRELSLSCRRVSTIDLHAWGSIAHLTDADDLMPVARQLAADLAAKPRDVLRYAKAALNHIDIYKKRKAFRLEQGYTYQLNLMGIGDRARNDFIAGTRVMTR